MFSESHVVQLAAIPLTGHDGFLWNRLHEEREEICERLLHLTGPDFETDRESLQEQLRIVDDSLDRLMS